MHVQARNMLHAWLLASGSARARAVLGWVAGAAWRKLQQQQQQPLHQSSSRSRLQLLCPVELQPLLQVLGRQPSQAGLEQLLAVVPGGSTPQSDYWTEASRAAGPCRGEAAAGQECSEGSSGGWPSLAPLQEAEWGWWAAAAAGGDQLGAGHSVSLSQQAWWLVLEHGQWRRWALNALASSSFDGVQQQQHGDERMLAGDARQQEQDEGCQLAAALLSWLEWPCDSNRCGLLVMNR